MTQFALGGLGLASNGYWSLAKSFWQRGGFSNGLNPTIVGKIWYVNTNTDVASERQGPIGNDGNSGLSPTTPFATVARAFEFINSYDWIVLDGDIREQVVAPDNIFDVTLLGAANTPRQATSGGVPTGGGCTWRGPASPTATTPLLELKYAGWRLINIEFTPVNASAAVRLTRSASVDIIDASHASFQNCYFASNGGTTQIGIEDNGGASRVFIDSCRFDSLGGTAIKGLNTSAAVPLQWQITNNLFLRNTNAIAMSATQALVANNVINQAANDANNKVNLVAVAGQGSLNFVLNNYFSDAAANVTIAKGYKPGTTDVWRNYVTDAADPVVTVPA